MVGTVGAVYGRRDGSIPPERSLTAASLIMQTSSIK
jgi:hypothetical protein